MWLMPRHGGFCVAVTRQHTEQGMWLMGEVGFMGLMGGRCMWLIDRRLELFDGAKLQWAGN